MSPSSNPPLAAPRELKLYTVGHSTHPIERFLELVIQHRIAILADIRSFPSSRRWPQFNQEPFAAALSRAGVEYRWIKRLGGRRHSTRPDSPHTGWTVAAFRSYADYTETRDFTEGIDELTAAAMDARTSIMCSEGLWWRCHRRIVSDQMTVRGWAVEHIMPDGKLASHRLPEFASVVDGRIIYDDGQRALID
jgi:uncharacterized protein (DUF488 family)